MSLNRYYGTLMDATYLPFSIYAPDEKEALNELKKNTPELTDMEKKELLFHVARLPQSDRIYAVNRQGATSQETLDLSNAQPQP